MKDEIVYADEAWLKSGFEAKEKDVNIQTDDGKIWFRIRTVSGLTYEDIQYRNTKIDMSGNDDGSSLKESMMATDDEFLMHSIVKPTLDRGKLRMLKSHPAGVYTTLLTEAKRYSGLLPAQATESKKLESPESQ